MSVLTAQSQDTVVVRIFTLNKKTKEVAPNVAATIINEQQSEYKSSGFLGRLILNVPTGTSLTIKLSHPYFLDLSKNFLVRGTKGDTIDIEYYLEPLKIKYEKEVIIRPPGEPDLVFGVPDFHVEDFELMPNANILLLTYQKNMNRGSELKIFNGQQITSSFQVPGEAEELIHDFRGNPHIVCRDNVFGVHQTDGVVGISSLEKQYFMTYLAPILDTNHTKMYFSNFNEYYPAFEYFIFDSWDSTYKKIVGIEDEIMMEQFMSEYKWLDVRTKLKAKNYELQTGIEAEVWAGVNYFTRSIYYKEAYSPMFHRNDTLFVFDYYKDKLYSFNSKGDIIDSLGIYHHYDPKKNGWTRNVQQDRVTGQIFAIFEKGGYTYVGLINTNDGLIHEKVKLKHRYIEKIQIQGNQVYYIYRPFESIQKKYLYKEGLPYKFKGAKVELATEESSDDASNK